MELTSETRNEGGALGQCGKGTILCGKKRVFETETGGGWSDGECMRERRERNVRKNASDSLDISVNVSVAKEHRKERNLGKVPC